MNRFLLCTVLLTASTAALAAPQSARHDIDKVNGGITAEAGQAYGELSTVNGGIETVNGSIFVDRGGKISEGVSTVNGGIGLIECLPGIERGIQRFGYMLTRIMLVMVVAVLAINVFMARPPIDSLLFALALAVGMNRPWLRCCSANMMPPLPGPLARAMRRRASAVAI